MRRFHLILVWLAATMPAIAVARPSVVGPERAGAVACVADAGRVLDWLAGVRALGRALGLPGKGLDRVSALTREAAGHDLLDPTGWKAAGLRPEGPVCVFALVREDDDLVVTFPVSEEKRARDTLARLFKAASPPVQTRLGKARAWGIRAAFEPGLTFAVSDGLGYLALDRSHLDFLGRKGRDWSEDLALPEGDLSVVGIADVVSVAEALGDDDVRGFARTWVPKVRVEAVLSGGILDIVLRAENGGLLSMIAGAFQAASPAPDARMSAARIVPAGASSFLQLNLPLRAVLDAARVVTTGGSPGGQVPAVGSGPLADLLSSLSGDLTLYTEDGLVGLTLVASLSDQARAESALSGLAAQATEAGIPLTVAREEVSGVSLLVFRFGRPDASIRFPVFVAVRDARLFAAISGPRVAAAVAPPRERYLDRMDSPLATEGLKAGAVMVTHGFGTDFAGGLTAYAAAARGALSPEAAAWLDVFDLPALAMDLLYDGVAVLALGPRETTLTMKTRFLRADPASENPRERAWGEALRTRYSGRTAAWRAALWDIATTDDPYGRKARRILLQPEPLADLLIAAGAAGVATAMLARAEPAPGPASTPCQDYLMRACVGGDPEGPACRDARRYFENPDGPTQADEERCREALGKMDGPVP